MCNYVFLCKPCRVFFNLPFKSRKLSISGKKRIKAQSTPKPLRQMSNARKRQQVKYSSPGLKSDILRGNSLPRRAATSHIIAYRKIA